MGRLVLDSSTRVNENYSTRDTRRIGAWQNVASYLAKHLGINCKLGAEWYEYMLVDYDVSSNWGNWQYVTGVGNDPRGERAYSIRSSRPVTTIRGENW